MIDQSGIISAAYRGAKAPPGHVVVINPRTGDYNYIPEGDISRPRRVPVSSVGGSVWYALAGPLFKAATILALFFVVFVLGLYVGGRNTCVPVLKTAQQSGGVIGEWPR